MSFITFKNKLLQVIEVAKFRKWFETEMMLKSPVTIFREHSLITTVPLFDTSNVTSFEEMFYYCTSLKSVPLFNTSNAETLYRMFYSCYALETVPNFDTSKVTNFGYMFQNCAALKNAPNIDVSNGTSFSNMFYNCSQLESLTLNIKPQEANQSLNYFVYGCSNLKSVYLGDTSGVTNFGSAFYNCTALETISKLDLSSVTSANMLRYIFRECTALKNVSFEPECIYWSLSVPCANLTTESIQSLIDGLGTPDTQMKLTLHSDIVTALTDEQMITISNKNWSVL